MSRLYIQPHWPVNAEKPFSVTRRRGRLQVNRTDGFFRHYGLNSSIILLGLVVAVCFMQNSLAAGLRDGSESSLTLHEEAIRTVTVGAKVCFGPQQDMKKEKPICEAGGIGGRNCANYFDNFKTSTEVSGWHITCEEMFATLGYRRKSQPRNRKKSVSDNVSCTWISTAIAENSIYYFTREPILFGCTVKPDEDCLDDNFMELWSWISPDRRPGRAYSGWLIPDDRYYPFILREKTDLGYYPCTEVKKSLQKLILAIKNGMNVVGLPTFTAYVRETDYEETQEEILRD